MRRIISVEHIEELEDKAGRTYFRTHAIVDTGQEVVGYGADFDLNDLVEVFYDPKWDTIKMRKGLTD